MLVCRMWECKYVYVYVGMGYMLLFLRLELGRRGFSSNWPPRGREFRQPSKWVWPSQLYSEQQSEGLCWQRVALIHVLRVPHTLFGTSYSERGLTCVLCSCRTLEQDYGIHCNLTLLFSFAQVSFMPLWSNLCLLTPLLLPPRLWRVLRLGLLSSRHLWAVYLIGM